MAFLPRTSCSPVLNHHLLSSECQRLNSTSLFLAVEQAYFDGDRIGMSRSHAAVLDDESGIGLGTVKNCSMGENDKLTLVVGEGLGSFSLTFPQLLAVGLSS